MAHHSAGDVYPRDFDAILRLQRTVDGDQFIGMQMGGAMPARRLGPPPQRAKQARPAAGRVAARMTINGIQPAC